MGKQNQTRLYVVIYLLLIFATFAAYLPTLHNGFTSYDDTAYVTDNLHVQQGLTARSVAWAFSPESIYRTGNWHPLTWLSIMLDCQLFHLNPMGHHLTSLLFHIANSLLLFLLLLRMTGSAWRGAFVAALFAIHPLHVESVAWVSERKDVLSAFFWLLTMLAYLGYSKIPSLKRYALVTLPFVLGLMCKPMLVTLPIVLLLIDFWPLRRFGESKWQTLVLEKLPLLAISIAASVITLATQSHTAIMRLTGISLPIRMANAVVVYVAYLVKMIWPRGLAAFYPHPRATIPTFEVLGSAFLLALIFALAIRMRKQAPCLLVGWLWYFVTLIPVIGIVQVGQQAMADRYTYLPLIGIFIAIAWTMPDLMLRRFAIPAALVVAALVPLTWQQVCYWHDTGTLFRHALACTERNYIALDMVGCELIQHGSTAQATRYFRKAAEVKPDDPAARRHLGMILMAQNRLREAEAELRKATQLDPNDADAQGGLGALLLQQGRYDEAAQCYGVVLKQSPDDSRANFSLGSINMKKGMPEAAIENLSRAVESEPKFAEAHTELGNAYAASSRPDEAADQWRQAAALGTATIKLHHKDSAAYFNLAIDQQNLREFPDAARNFRQALKLRPRFWEAANDLGFILATSNNPACHAPAEALKLATTANQLTGNRNPDVIDTLAAAYAANGRFAEAAAAEQKAIELAGADKSAAMRQRLELYKSHRPYTAP